MASPTYDPRPEHVPLLPTPRRMSMHAADVVRWVLFLGAILGLLLTTAPISLR